MQKLHKLQELHKQFEKNENPTASVVSVDSHLGSYVRKRSTGQLKKSAYWYRAFTKKINESIRDATATFRF